MNYAFPTNVGYFDENELIKLALSLGFHSSLFTKHLKSELKINPQVKTNSIIQLLKSTDFIMDIHKTTNIHDKDYNSNLIRKACLLLEQRTISFPILANVCKCFSFYEDKDGNGIVADRQIILSVLKMCNRVMSRLQLINELHNIAPELIRPMRLTLMEFLDLYLLSTDLVQLENYTQLESVPSGKDVNGLFRFSPACDTKSLQYERILSKLDQEYRNSVYVTAKAKRIPLDLSPLIKTNIRRDLQNKSQGSLRGLCSQLLHSEGKLLSRGQVKCNSCLPLTDKGVEVVSAIDNILIRSNSQRPNSQERSRGVRKYISPEERLKTQLSKSEDKPFAKSLGKQFDKQEMPTLGPAKQLNSPKARSIHLLDKTTAVGMDRKPTIGEAKHDRKVAWGDSTVIRDRKNLFQMDDIEGEIMELKWKQLRSKTNLSKYIANLKSGKDKEEFSTEKQTVE